jgi:HEAT repeat protein
VIAPFATPGSPLEAPALAATARIDGGLSKSAAEGLLRRPEASIRETVVRFSRDGVGDARLSALMREDPAPQVRAAALQTLIAQRGSDALDSVLPSLFDSDPLVTRAASLGIASLGSEAVPELRRLLEQRPFGQPRELAPVAFAMAMAGPEGRRALDEISASHPDDRVRRLAGLALGRFSGDSH